MKSREELEQLTNEQLAAVYEDVIGYDPFKEEEIKYERGGNKRHPDTIREAAIQVLTETEE